MNDILDYKGYKVCAHSSSVDDVFFGKILGINDLVSFEGASVKGLKKAFAVAVENHLKTCQLVGKQPKKT